MRAKLLIIGMVFLLVPWLLAGCGVAQEQYDNVVADLNQTSKDLHSVRSELQAAQDKVSELTPNLDKTQASLMAAEAKNSELTSSLEKAEKELQAGSAELTASVQKSQAELEVAQAKVLELTSSLEKAEIELETTKSEYEAFKSEVESLLVLSYDQHVALQRAYRDASSAVATDDLSAFRSAVKTVKDILADLNDVKADRLKSLWNDAYYIEEYYVGSGETMLLEWRWGLHYRFSSDFQRLNGERTVAVRKVLEVYYNKWTPPS